MNFTVKERKETIEILHNSLEEIKKNMAKLKEEGWSDNLFNSYIWKLKDEDIRMIKDKYPNVKIQQARNNSFLFPEPYVFRTQHERVIEGSEIIFKEAK
ncbi:hypothetical protein U8V72_23035 [Priestia filamentosa]|uniref:hypothetical protein n=1 Tax=Priestia filamentosa TaxID=1402861 RepID=UPI00397BD8F9